MKALKRINLFFGITLLLSLTLFSCNNVELEEVRLTVEKGETTDILIQNAEREQNIRFYVMGVWYDKGYWYEMDYLDKDITNWTFVGECYEDLFEEKCLITKQSSFDIDVEFTKNGEKIIKREHYDFHLDEARNGIWWVRPIEDCSYIAYEFAYCNNQNEDTIYTLSIIDKGTHELIASTSTSDRNYIAIEGSNGLKNNIENLEIVIEFDGYRIIM